MKFRKDIKIRVTKTGELLSYLIEALPQMSRKELKALLSHKSIIVGNKIQTQFDYKLRVGQEIIIDYNNKYEFLRIYKIGIIYEDDYLIAIDKPTGLLSVATEDKSLKTVFTIMNEYVKLSDKNARIYIVHRLDRETSGVMIVAKNEEFKNKLQDNWAELVISRKYYALTEGVFEKKEDVITQYLKQNKGFSMYNSGEADGEKAVTEYKVIKENENYSLVDISIKTGKKNQIRVAMRELGHFIVGDKKYGSKINPIKRMGLHSYLLEIVDQEQKILSFESKLPKEFNSVFK